MTPRVELQDGEPSSATTTAAGTSSSSPQGPWRGLRDTAYATGFGRRRKLVWRRLLFGEDGEDGDDNSPTSTSSTSTSEDLSGEDGDRSKADADEAEPAQELRIPTAAQKLHDINV